MKNKYEIINNKVKIFLKNNLFTMIDIEDFEIVNNFKNSWYAKYNKYQDLNYVTSKMIVGNKRVDVRLHRYILGLRDIDFVVDHINLIRWTIQEIT